MPHPGRKAWRGVRKRPTDSTAVKAPACTRLLHYLQTGLMPGHIQKLKSMAMHDESAGPSIQVG